MSKNTLTDNARKALLKAQNGEELQKNERQSLTTALANEDLSEETRQHIKDALNPPSTGEVSIPFDKEGAENFSKNFMEEFTRGFNMELLNDVGKLYAEEGARALCAEVHDAATNAACAAITRLFPKNSGPRAFFTGPIGGKLMYLVVSGAVNTALMQVYKQTGSQFTAIRYMASGGARNSWDEVFGLFDLGAMFTKLHPAIGVLLNFRENGTETAKIK